MTNQAFQLIGMFALAFVGMRVITYVLEKSSFFVRFFWLASKTSPVSVPRSFRVSAPALAAPVHLPMAVKVQEPEFPGYSKEERELEERMQIPAYLRAGKQIIF